MKKFILLALFALLVLPTAAQETGISSPYSRYGLGLLNDRSTGFNKALLGTGIGMSNGKQLNLTNPASYARIDSLTFLLDVGVTLQNNHLSANALSINDRRALFDYLAMGFRLSPRLGVSLGLMPFSSVGYNLSTQGTVIDNGSSGTITPTTSYTGDGGLHQAYMGLGFTPLRPLALGVNVGYLWGVNTHTALTSYSDASVQSLRRVYETEVRSYTLDFGAQWSLRLHPKHAFTLGLTYGSGHQLHGKSHFYNQRISNNSIAAADTLTVSNAFELPQSFGVGLNWQYQNRLRVALDYTYQAWSRTTAAYLRSYDNGTFEYLKGKGSYTDLHRINIGAEYVADPNGYTWSDRVRYRMGLSYSTPYAKIDNRTGPRSYAASLGVGLPIITGHNNRSFLNISAQYEHVKPQFAGQLTERYFRVSIGLSFNERWFQKWQVD